MALQDIEERYRRQKRQLGAAALHALYPKDFSYYFLALQLVDSRNNTVDYFAWPILPDELRETHTELTSIKKTMAGVNVVKNPTFNPRPISIRGNFGRRFKLLIAGQSIEFAGFNLSMMNGKFDITNNNILDNVIPQFSSFAKNGYGCIKILEAIKEKSKKLDGNNKPYSLFLYNPVLGNNYQVEFNSFSHFQDKDTHNMVPGYTIQLTAIAPLDSVLSRINNIKSAIKNLSLVSLQKTANQVASKLKLLPRFRR
jgi:hypothetical protein